MTHGDISDQYRELINLLVLWHRIEDQAPSSLGFPRESIYCHQFLTSRQYDDTNGAFDTSERASMAGHVGRIAMSLEEPYRTALAFLARNRATGRNVWKSPRLPLDETERALLVSEAVGILAESV